MVINSSQPIFYRVMASDSLETNHLRLFFKEAEVICRLFAEKYKLNPDDVLGYGLGHILKEHKEVREHLLPTVSDINNLSLPELKQECRIRKLKVGGNKDLLKHRLETEVSRLQNLLAKTDDN